MSNPLLELTFPIPFDAIEASHLEPAAGELLEQAGAQLERIAASTEPRSYANTLAALERATEPLELAMTVADHLENTCTNDALREAYTAVKPKVSAFYSSIPTNAGLWEALGEFAETEEAQQLDATRARFLEKTLDGFRRAGAELNDSDKAKLLELDVELSTLTNQFAQNMLDATNAWELVIEDEARLAGLPESARAAARESAEQKDLEGWRFTLQAPSLMPAITYLEDASLRRQILDAYSTRATSGELDNRPLIARILELRQTKAELLGFKNFADLVLDDRMAKTGDKAQAFLADLRARSKDASAREHRELTEFRRSIEGPDAPRLEAWDVAFYAEKQRQELYQFDEEQLRPYFSVPKVLAGLFEIVNRLYGIRVEETELPIWDESVRTYAMRAAHDGSDQLLAYFYVDLHPRESKRGGAWMNPIYSSVPEQGTQEPHVGLFCANVAPPVGDQPALLTHREVETLFHEFGHLVHHCASRVTVRSLAGTNVAWDFVELPSQIMENWCWEREALDLFARHHETDQPIPDELFERMLRARTYRGASQLTRQLSFASMDQALHCKYVPARDGEVAQYSRDILRSFSESPIPDEYAMVTCFGHLFTNAIGYAAGYYSYLWAEVLDADAFARFKEEGIFDPSVGADFLELISSGDSADPMQLFVAFRGREPELDALLVRNGLA